MKDCKYKCCLEFWEDTESQNSKAALVQSTTSVFVLYIKLYAKHGTLCPRFCFFIPHIRQQSRCC